MSLATVQVVRARRLLHCSYCGGDGPGPAAWLAALGWTAAVDIPARPVSGRLLGFGGDVTLWATLVFDGRGPGRSPALEVQHWVEPPPIGAAGQRPGDAGIRAVGVV